MLQDELLRISSASINAAIMDKLCEYQKNLQKSDIKKEQIAASLIAQAVAVLKMSKARKAPINK